MRKTFFFDSHPPFGKQLIAIAAYFANFDGNFLGIRYCFITFFFSQCNIQKVNFSHLLFVFSKIKINQKF